MFVKAIILEWLLLFGIFKRGKEGKGKEVGVFASRTPHRTSRLAVSNVELLKISGTRINVKGLDAFEGSMVLDIKSIKKEGNI